MSLNPENQILYAMGFVCSEDGERVLLLLKNKPDNLKGCWMGVGGKVDPGENFLDSMVRECSEETSMNIPAEKWKDLGAWSNPTANIGMFMTFADLSKANALSDTNEEIRAYRWDEIKDLKLARSCHEIIEQVRVLASSKKFNHEVSPSYRATSLKSKVVF